MSFEKIQTIKGMARDKTDAEKMMLYETNKKSPGLALILSLLIPGAGQIYNGEVGKGIAMLIVVIVCWMFFFLLIPILVAIVIWVWGIIDAHHTAQNYNTALYSAIFST